MAGELRPDGVGIARKVSGVEERQPHRLGTKYTAGMLVLAATNPGSLASGGTTVVGHVGIRRVLRRRVAGQDGDHANPDPSGHNSGDRRPEGEHGVVEMWRHDNQRARTATRRGYDVLRRRGDPAEQ